MSAFEREISVLMIETGGIEVNDIGVAPTMFAVTRLALSHRYVSQTAVEAAVTHNISSDFFVTAQA